ncbi:low-density lipoprotein receptor-related protein 2-like [Asterias rubens]|uniref:low-density lipoprotein receptor-related protein 2-like n=1 Tax=Asterias rubens TaxID=7604 RepID=UPI00145519D7|nr:low-density lipoprotein receptor-related protein 2-like [Asterias rubens]
MAGPVFIWSGPPLSLVLFIVFTAYLHCTVSQTTMPCDGVRCMDFSCISSVHVCDGYSDCVDGLATDELDCPVLTPCRIGYERCPGTAGHTINVCIPPEWRCDGDNDCGDHSDENVDYCRETPCPSTMIKCADSFRCISGTSYCNGVRNCADGSDEPAECLTESFTCPTDHFKCANGRRCVPNQWLCDRDDDCGDNSDEDDAVHSCSTHVCSDEYFTCRQNRPGFSKCVALDLVCDGTSHCENAEDEDPAFCGTRHPCQSYEYQCLNYLCIPSWYQCDHDNDCGDGSDEGAHCDYPTCRDDIEFTCNNGRCIPLNQRCNGYDNCRDSSDEQDCTCPEGFFQCRNKQCIPEDLVCNGSPNCTDSSDIGPSCNVNECRSPDYPACSYGCVDEPLSYHCTCDDGYTLGEDQHTCVDFDECAETPSVCSQVCINLAGSYLCTCAWGYTHGAEGCVVNYGGDPFIVFGNRYYIRRLGIEQNSVDYDRIADDFDLIVALDFDYVDQKIYFSDIGNHSINRMNMDGTNIEQVHTNGVINTEGLAVDWVTKKLYWIDRNRDVMEVSDLDGKNRLVLISSGLFEPRAIALDPEHGYAYWTDWGLRPYIGRIGMDGTDKMELHDERVGWPNGLTIDYAAQHVYWVDAHLDYISYSDMDFNHIHRLLHDDEQHTIAHPFAITVFGDYIYFTDWNLKGVYKAHKYNGQEVEIRATVHRPFGIQVVHPLRQDPTLSNVCVNAPCEGLCLIAPGGNEYTCACAENHVVNGHRCIPACTTAQFACIAEQKCIPWYRQCNGINDCSDNSDEQNCPVRYCQPGEYQCNDGSCLQSILWLCDGDRDCSDGSDEGSVAKCSVNQCDTWQFSCLDRSRCISERRVCNQISDCNDGSDELNCDTHMCAEGYFKCTTSGFCIPEEWKCDLDNDCGDNSDEPHRECQNVQCPDGWISCLNSFRCIPEYARCNGYDECRDNSDEIGCEEVTCDPLGEFRCDNHRCIPQRWFCDFDNDCGDSSDEPLGCEPRPCSESEFRCVSRGRCIRDRWRCDGSPDCSDGSDEEGCGVVCRLDQFACAIGGCIPANLTCNGFDNCFDRSDEMNCTNRVCTADEFRCSNTLCVPQSSVCNTYDDCGDGSDESTAACMMITCDLTISFECAGNGFCLPPHKLCDGNDDCGDNSDEHSQCEVQCTPSTYHCQNEQCISWDKVCDSFQDCRDGSDETSCFKNPTECNTMSCQKQCIALGSSFICSCGAGFAASSDGICEDIDECYLSRPCDQVCFNRKGSYDCRCANGFEDRGIDGQDCKPIGAQEVIVFGDGTEVRKYLRFVDQYQSLVINEERIESLDFDYKSGHLYFTDSELRAIKRVKFSNENASQAPDNLGLDNVYRPMGIAVDWLGNNIYFADQGLETRDGTRGKRAAADRGPKIVVASAREYPFHEKTLHTATQPYAIAVNPRKGLMYWTDLGVSPHGSLLFMSWMNGEYMTPINVAAAKLYKPTGLAVDYTGNDTVYWCDSGADMIGYITYDGSLFRVIAKEGLSNPFQLDVFGNDIYWTTRSTDNRGQVRSMNKTGQDHELILNGVNLPTGIKMWQEQRYPLTEPNPCERNPCLYLCLIVPPQKNSAVSKGFECACPSGVEVDPTHCRGTPVPTPTTTLPCKCDNGGMCRADGTCDCLPGYIGANCATADKSEGGGPTSVLIIGPLVGFIILAIIIIVILLFIFYRKRNKFAGPVAYRDGQNVDIAPPPVAVESHYETRLDPAAPVTIENPAYATLGAAGGGVPNLPEKTGLPYDVSEYQPGFQAGPLPPKDYMQDGMLTAGGYPEPPPAYTANNPPSPEIKDPNNGPE